MMDIVASRLKRWIGEDDEVVGPESFDEPVLTSSSLNVRDGGWHLDA